MTKQTATMLVRVVLLGNLIFQSSSWLPCLHLECWTLPQILLKILLTRFYFNGHIFYNEKNLWWLSKKKCPWLVYRSSRMKKKVFCLFHLPANVWSEALVRIGPQTWHKGPADIQVDDSSWDRCPLEHGPKKPKPHSLLKAFIFKSTDRNSLSAWG